MKQRAGERGEVEDLLALVEGFDIDGAEGDVGGLGAQQGDELVEVIAAADKYG
jgi:hypothetical protein